MALASGTRFGAYEIKASVGAGGMGEVYLATDTKLGRNVALKLLSDLFAGDADRLARFDREAKTLASLNHPHIAQIHGIEESNGVRALVMELVEGGDLAARLERGAIAIDEALPIARQIAEALEAAHDQGVIHRDLKPANIKVRPDGTVKVLDFGLAKLTPAGNAISSGSQALVNSPTITTPAMTQAGLIMGTAAYMSPEQAKGRLVDRRADIWAFGCVLYEMLTGRRAFHGEDISDTMVAIFRDEPDWRALPVITPPHVVTLIRQCLQKDPQKRLPHLGVARIELSDTAANDRTADAPRARTRRATEALAWMTAGAVLAASVGWLLLRGATPAQPAPTVHFQIGPPQGGTFPGGNGVPRFAVAPDGTSIAYQASAAKGVSHLYIRRLDSLATRIVDGSEDARTGNAAQQPFWSADNRFVAFFNEAEGVLKKVDMSTGLVQAVAKVPGNQYGGSWSQDNVILFASTGTNGIQRVPAGGGTPTQVTTVPNGVPNVLHLWPVFHPDGRHFLYLVSGPSDSAGVYVTSLVGGQPKRLLESRSMAQFAGSERLLYVKDDALVSQQFDLATLELKGEPVLVAPNILRTPAGRVAASASTTNVLAYAAGTVRDDRFGTVWLDRNGNELSPQPPVVSAGRGGLRLSNDGRLMLFAREITAAGRPGDVWVKDLARGVETPLSVGRDTPGLPVLSPDGSQIFTSSRAADNTVQLAVQPLAAGVNREVIAKAGLADEIWLGAWSSDGRYLVYLNAAGTARGIWMVPVHAGDRTPTQYLSDTVMRNGVALSPDARWIAYALGDRPQDVQVFVQAFPRRNGTRVAVSPVGGTLPLWRQDGRELFFVDDGAMVAVSVSIKGNAIEVGPPQKLFDLPRDSLTLSGAPYGVTQDGQRFVYMRGIDTVDQATQLSVVVSWRPEEQRTKN